MIEFSTPGSLLWQGQRAWVLCLETTQSSLALCLPAAFTPHRLCSRERSLVTPCAQSQFQGWLPREPQARQALRCSAPSSCPACHSGLSSSRLLRGLPCPLPLKHLQPPLPSCLSPWLLGYSPNKYQQLFCSLPC